ncbi:MAG: VOC family protein [Thermomicrobiales bacterium]
MRTSFEGITLHVSDMERSKAFYLRIPGATLLFERPSSSAIVGIGKARVGLLARSILAADSMAADEFHLEIGTDDLAALRAQLRSAGIEPVGPQPEQWGERGMVTRDPDGYIVEFDDHFGTA